MPYTANEIKTALKNLGSQKVCSNYNILYEDFKETVDITVSALVLFFNSLIGKGNLSEMLVKRGYYTFV